MTAAVFQASNNVFSLAAAELSHKMAAHLSQAIRLPPSARALHVCVCQMRRSGAFLRSKSSCFLEGRGGRRLLRRGPVSSCAFFFFFFLVLEVNAM